MLSDAKHASSDGEVRMHRSLPESSTDRVVQCMLEQSVHANVTTCDDKAVDAKKNKRTFLPSFVHRNNKEDPERKTSQQVRLSELLSNDVQSTNTSPSFNNSNSITSKTLRSVADDVDAEMASYLSCASGGLRRGSKSDYDLRQLRQRRPLTPEPATMRKDAATAMGALSHSSDQLMTQSCTAVELRSAKHSSQQYNVDDVDGRDKRESFVRRLSRKVKSMSSNTKTIPTADVNVVDVFGDAVQVAAKSDRRGRKFEVLDLTDEAVSDKSAAPVRKLTYSMHLAQLGMFPPKLRPHA